LSAHRSLARRHRSYRARGAGHPIFADGHRHSREALQLLRVLDLADLRQRATRARARARGCPARDGVSAGKTMSAWFHRHRTAILVYGVALIAYFAASGRRVPHPSRAPHFVYLADALLHGRLALAGNPPNDDDWARLETLTLKDGRTVRGQFASGQP